MTTSNNAYPFYIGNIVILVGLYRIRNIVASDAPISFRTLDAPSSIVAGYNAAMIPFHANPRIEFDIDIIANSFDNTVLSAINLAKASQNKTPIPASISSLLGQGTPWVPLIIRDSGNTEFLITTRGWTLTNNIDVSLPNSGQGTLSRRWTFQLLSGASSLLGALGQRDYTT